MLGRANGGNVFIFHGEGRKRARGCAKLFEQKWLEKVDFFKMTFFLKNGCHEALQYKRAPSADASEHQI